MNLVCNAINRVSLKITLSEAQNYKKKCKVDIAENMAKVYPNDVDTNPNQNHQGGCLTLHFTLYTLHFTLYILHFTLYTLHFTLHTLHFTFYTLHIKKLCTCSTEYHTITLYMGTIVLDTNNPDCLIFISTVGTFKLRINACLISSFQLSHLSINLACLSVCLSVCLYPINVKTAEPIGPKFFVGHLGIPGKVYE